MIHLTIVGISHYTCALRWRSSHSSRHILHHGCLILWIGHHHLLVLHCSHRWHSLHHHSWIHTSSRCTLRIIIIIHWRHVSRILLKVSIVHQACSIRCSSFILKRCEALIPLKVRISMSKKASTLSFCFNRILI